MAKNVLLDTNILRQLISPTEFNPYLRQIIEWQKEGHVRLYCPPTLKREWKKHSEIEFKRIRQILKNHESALKASNLFEVTPDVTDVKLNAAEKRLWAQVEALDQLMESAVIPSEGGEAVIRMWEHRTAGKAPFRVKENSENDAVILFSTLEQLIKKQESELYFFSTNHKDYAAPGNEEFIHADISDAFPSVKIMYFTDVVQGVNNLTEVGLPTNKEKLGTSKMRVPNFFPVDQTKNEFEQLYEYLDKRFADIDFLPKRLFTYHYPIIIGADYQERREAFTINTDNQTLFESLAEKFADLVESRASGKIGSEHAKMEDELLSYLRNNLVRTIRYNHRETLQLPLSIDTNCTCVVCTYNKGNFYSSFSLLEQVRDEPESLKKAYTFYLHGMWGEAVSILKKVSESAESNHKWLTHYIAKYNLMLLGRLSKYHSFDGALESNVFAELREIEMDSVLEECKSPSNNKILEMLHYGKFLDHASEEMQTIVSKIKNSQIDQDSGWSEDASKMLDLFFETIYFMERNYIMVDAYSDVNRFTEYFLDGLFASYQCNENLSGKVGHLSDPILAKIISYANADKIIKYKERYDIKKMKYVRDNVGSTFVIKIIEMLKSYEFLIDLFKNKKYDRISSVWSKFRRIVVNTLTVTSLVEMKADEIEAISRELLPFLKIQNHIQELELTNALSYFLKSNAGLMHEEILREFLHLAFTGQGFDRDTILNSISGVAKKEKLTVCLKDLEWQLWSSEYLIVENAEEVIVEICYLYLFTTNSLHKSAIIDFIEKSLEANFNGRIYYMTVMDGLLQPTEKFNEKYETEILQFALEGRQPRIFETKSYNHRYIDEFINLSFYLDRPISTALKAALAILDQYYTWLIDIDGFNYEKFDPDWLYKHLTIYYKKYFRTSDSLKRKIRSEIMKSTDFRLARLYLDLYEEKSQ